MLCCVELCCWRWCCVLVAGTLAPQIQMDPDAPQMVMMAAQIQMDLDGPQVVMMAAQIQVDLDGPHIEIAENIFIYLWLF